MDLRHLANITQAHTPQNEQTGTFKSFDATELYCVKCQQAVPVRKRLLLVLPEGEKFEYLCTYCAEPVGTKIERNQKPMTIIV